MNHQGKDERMVQAATGKHFSMRWPRSAMSVIQIDGQKGTTP